MLRSLIRSDGIRQFISYFGVGGAAALVEWIVFFFLENILGVQYLLATVFAFIVSTTTNWLLGRMFTFKNSSYKNRRLKELVLVFIVSMIGLGFNLVLMYLFVDCLHFDTGLLKTAAKTIATGIVFFWNFFARKMFVYKCELPID